MISHNKPYQIYNILTKKSRCPQGIAGIRTLLNFGTQGSVVSDSLRPHESQHARPPCPSPTPGVHPDSCPSSQWCHSAISSSVVPFSSCPQSLPASVLILIAFFTRFRFSGPLIVSHTFCCCSVSQSCKTLCNPMSCSMPGFSVPRHLPKFALHKLYF